MPPYILRPWYGSIDLWIQSINGFTNFVQDKSCLLSHSNFKLFRDRFLVWLWETNTICFMTRKSYFSGCFYDSGNLILILKCSSQASGGKCSFYLPKIASNSAACRPGCNYVSRNWDANNYQELCKNYLFITLKRFLSPWVISISSELFINHNNLIHPQFHKLNYENVLSSVKDLTWLTQFPFIQGLKMTKWFRHLMLWPVQINLNLKVMQIRKELILFGDDCFYSDSKDY